MAYTCHSKPNYRMTTSKPNYKMATSKPNYKMATSKLNYRMATSKPNYRMATWNGHCVPSLAMYSKALSAVHALLLSSCWSMVSNTHTHTHTHMHTCTCTCITTARVGYMAPIQGVSQQKATRLVAPLAAGTPASSPQLHGPLSAVGVLIYGLARPMRRER